MEEHRVNIDIDSDTETRKGVYGNVTMLVTKGGTTRIDFLNADIPVESESMRAVLAARIYMDNADIIALRDMLVSHTATWKVEADDKEA